jgi:hypothetical protein
MRVLLSRLGFGYLWDCKLCVGSSYDDDYDYGFNYENDRYLSLYFLQIFYYALKYMHFCFGCYLKEIYDGLQQIFFTNLQ